jgi:Ca2+:H+ antiporter
MNGRVLTQDDEGPKMNTSAKGLYARFLPGLPRWTILSPLAAWMVLGGSKLAAGVPLLFLLGTGLVACVLASVHHAEVIAERFGEPLGTLILTMAITLIEVSLIVSLMRSGGHEAEALARDTVFATVMLILNAVIGLCLIVGGAKHGEQPFQIDAATASLVTLAAVTVLTLIFPNYTVTTPGPFYSAGQLALISVVSVVIYGTFIFTQTVGHREYFLQSEHATLGSSEHKQVGNVLPATSAVLLLLSLAAVVISAELLAPSVEAAVERAGAPNALVGIIVATIVLLPEGLAALRTARENRLQTSLNLALGSALASIGLTIPVVSLLSLYWGSRLELGIDTKSSVLLILSLFLMALVLRTGRTIVLHGVILLVIFVVYLFTTVVP